MFLGEAERQAAGRLQEDDPCTHRAYPIARRNRSSSALAHRSGAMSWSTTAADTKVKGLRVDRDLLHRSEASRKPAVALNILLFGPQGGLRMGGAVDDISYPTTGDACALFVLEVLCRSVFACSSPSACPP